MQAVPEMPTIQFRRVSQWVILALATLCIVGGLRQLIGT